MAATSFFTYPITRRYPARFTWIIIVGAVVLTTFFTFAAIPANAYEMESSYTSDYNATIANKTWYQREPFSWAAEIENTCQPALLTIGDDHTTTNQGFHYAIESFSLEGNANDVPLTASYRNGSLFDCAVEEIVIELLRSNQARLPLNRWSWGSTVARSTAACIMSTDDGPLRVSFTHQLPVADRHNDIVKSFLSLNDSEHPGRYLGAQLLAARYNQLSTAMGYSVPADSNFTDPNGASWASGRVALMRNDRITDYESLEFFNCGASFSRNDRGLSSMLPTRTMQNWTDQWSPESAARDFQPALPNISTVVDVFSKTYYSLLLSDFNSTNETMRTNALLTRPGLSYLQNVNDTDLNSARQKFGGDGNGTIYPYLSDATTTTNLTQPLVFAEHTTLFSRYLCSRPKPKQFFKLFFAVVMADIVFLSACWTLFGWIAGCWLGRRSSDTEFCIGCINAAHEIPLVLAPGGAGGGGSYSQVSSEAGDERRSHEGRLSAPHIARTLSGV